MKYSRNRLASIIAGLLFGVGWWLIIDVACEYRSKADFNPIYHLIGVGSTIALILVNAISNSRIQSDGHCGARVLLFLAFILAFGSIIGSIWLLFGYYIRLKKEHLYPGIGIFGQNLAIFLSTMVLKFGRKENEDY